MPLHMSSVFNPALLNQRGLVYNVVIKRRRFGEGHEHVEVHRPVPVRHPGGVGEVRPTPRPMATAPSPPPIPVVAGGGQRQGESARGLAAEHPAQATQRPQSVAAAATEALRAVSTAQPARAQPAAAPTQSLREELQEALQALERAGYPPTAISTAHTANPPPGQRVNVPMLAAVSLSGRTPGLPTPTPQPAGQSGSVARAVGTILQALPGGNVSVSHINEVVHPAPPVAPPSFPYGFPTLPVANPPVVEVHPTPVPMAIPHPVYATPVRTLRVVA